MPEPAIGLIAGLGNPGRRYADTRHNAGFWFLQALQETFGFSLQEDLRSKGHIGRFSVGGSMVRVIAPMTFMNLCGDSVISYSRYYRIPHERILVAYDELDLAPGTVRFKLEGGHGGHNGLRDIMQKAGSQDFKRLRFGIGHPGSNHSVSGYVLSRPDAEDRTAILSAIDRAVAALPDILDGEFSRVMNFLHTD